MKKLMMLILLCLVFVGLSEAAVVFEDDFAGTVIDTAKWAITGTVTQNETLLVSGAGWDVSYATSIPAAASASGANPLIWELDHAGVGASTLLGLYDDGTFSGYSADTVYGWHYNGTLYPLQNADFAVPVAVTSGGDLQLRITLGTVDGALFEYDEKLGAGWQVARDTRNLGSGPVNASKDWQMYLMSDNPSKNYDDVSLSYVPEPATMVLFGLGSLLLRRRR